MDDFNARDLFAGLAMVGLIMRNGGNSYERTVLSPLAYEIADAMIKEKEKRDERVED